MQIINQVKRCLGILWYYIRFDLEFLKVVSLRTRGNLLQKLKIIIRRTHLLQDVYKRRFRMESIRWIFSGSGLHGGAGLPSGDGTSYRTPKIII